MPYVPRVYEHGFVDENGNYNSFAEMGNLPANPNDPIGIAELGESDGPDERFEDYKLPFYDDPSETEKFDEYYQWLTIISNETLAEFKAFIREYVQKNGEVSFYDLMVAFQKSNKQSD